MGDPINLYEVDSEYLDLRSRIGEHLIKMTGLEVDNLNKLSTDTLLRLSWALEDVYEKAFSLGVQSGGRDAFDIAAIQAEDVDQNLTEWEKYGLQDEREMAGARELDNEVLSGQANDELSDMVEADAVVVDALVKQMEALNQRFEALELQVGVKYVG